LTKDLISRLRTRFSSLYVGLVLNILLGIIVGVTVYALMQLVSDSYIRLNYASEARREEREVQELSELQKFITDGKLEAQDVIKVAEWASEKRYLYLMLYEGDRLVYTSDLGVIPTEGTIPESSDTVVNSGLTVDHPTNATLRRYASQSERVGLQFGESTLYASVYDYSEYMQYDVMNILSMVFAFVSLAFIIINYFRRIVKRIRRLEAEVTIVTHSSMEHKIISKGYDEIGRLADNIENMRKAILENLNREREARDANTELVTAMSHDIRTPLTVLLGYLEMMKGEVEEYPLLKEYAETSERTALRLKQLSDDMFKYSLAFGNSLDNLILEPYDAGMLFEQMLAEHVFLLSENGYNVEVSYKLDALPPGTVVITEPQNLMRIFDNVFSNVRKYADIEKPVCINARAVDGERIIFECINTVRTDEFKAESNKIGLKTCARLAEKIAERFEYGVFGEQFAARLYMKTEVILPDGAREGDEEKAEEPKKREGFLGIFLSFGDALRRVGRKIKRRLFSEKKPRRRRAGKGAKAVPSIKPIGYAKPDADEALTSRDLASVDAVAITEGAASAQNSEGVAVAENSGAASSNEGAGVSHNAGAASSDEDAALAHNAGAASSDEGVALAHNSGALLNNEGSAVAITNNECGVAGDNAGDAATGESRAADDKSCSFEIGEGGASSDEAQDFGESKGEGCSDSGDEPFENRLEGESLLGVFQVVKIDNDTEGEGASES